MPAQITALPTPPSTNDPANFNTRADAFLGQMPTFVTEANALASEVSTNTTQAAADRVQTGADRTAAAASAASALGAPGTNGTSTTSLTIGAGAKTFTTQTGKAWVAGQGFFVASSASPVNWMTGVLTAYNATSGAATVQVDTVGGSGTFAAWNCGLAAGRPLPVATQAQAEAGTDATTWMTPERTAQAAVAFGVPVGGVIQSASNPGSRWLPCTGLLYLKTSYPSLGAMFPYYIRPMSLRIGGAQSRGVVFGGGVFVYWGGSQLYTSVDGVSWVARSYPYSVPTRVAYGGGVFVATDMYSIYTSVDGIVWTQRSHPFSNCYIRSMYYGGSGWVICAETYDASESRYGTSANGVTWSFIAGVPRYFDVCAYNSEYSRWLAFSSGSSNKYYSVNGGQSWVEFSISLPTSPHMLVAGGGKFLLKGADNQLYSSVDGTSGFTILTNPPPGSVSFIYHDGVNFWATSSGGRVSRSADLISWITLTGAPSGDVQGFARSSGAITSPSVISMNSLGLYSGMDTSPTEFAAPSVASAGTNLNAYIKAS